GSDRTDHPHAARGAACCRAVLQGEGASGPSTRVAPRRRAGPVVRQPRRGTWTGTRPGASHRHRRRPAPAHRRPGLAAVGVADPRRLARPARRGRRVVRRVVRRLCRGRGGRADRNRHPLRLARSPYGGLPRVGQATQALRGGVL
ncbi:MAG: hypothetical protein AVDCRST_MAG60-2065, partial [uncultured Nocardioides sp.]